VGNKAASANKGMGGMSEADRMLYGVGDKNMKSGHFSSSFPPIHPIQKINLLFSP